MSGERLAMRQQRERAQAGMAMRRAVAGTECRLAGQRQAVAAAIAFGLVDPARQTRDARFVRRGRSRPCQSSTTSAPSGCSYSRTSNVSRRAEGFQAIARRASPVR